MAFLKDSVSLFITRVGNFFVGIITSIVIARVLGPSGKGEYSVIMLIPTVLVIFAGMGIGPANIYLVGKKRFSLDSIISNSILYSILLGLLFIGLFQIASGYIYGTFLKNINYHYINLALVIVPFSLLVQFNGNILFASGRVKQYNLLNIIRTIFFLLLIVSALVFFNLKTFGAVISNIVTSIVFGLASLSLLSNFSRIKFSVNPQVLIKSLSFGAKAYLGNIAQFLNYRFDIFLVNFFLGTASVGYYALAVGIAELIWYIPDAVAKVLFSKTASSIGEDPDKFTPFVSRHTFLLSLISALLIFLTARLIVGFFYGKVFLPSVKPLFVLLPGVVFFSIYKVLTGDLAGRNLPLIGSFSSIISLVINLPLNLILIPKWGIVGAAFASTIAYLVGTFIVIFAFLKISGNRLNNLIFVRRNDFKAYKGVIASSKKTVGHIRTVLKI